MKGCSVFWTVCAVSGFVSISEAFLQPSSILSSSRECGALLAAFVTFFQARVRLKIRAAVVVGRSSASYWYPPSSRKGVDTYTKKRNRAESSVIGIDVQTAGGAGVHV